MPILIGATPTIVTSLRCAEMAICTNEQWRIDLTLLRAQIDNGYDAFASTTGRTTESDHPSVDRQYSRDSRPINLQRIGRCDTHHHRHVCGHQGQLRL